MTRLPGWLAPFAPRRLALHVRIRRLSRLDDQEAAEYLAIHPELRGDDARAMLRDRLARAARAGDVGALRRMYTHVALAASGSVHAADGAIPLAPDEIARRHEDAVTLAHTDDPAALGHVIARLEALLDDPGFRAARDEARVPVLSDAGSAWLRRFEVTGNLDDLGRAGAHLEHAAALAAPRPVDQGVVLSNLAIVEMRIFDVTGVGEHLRRAVELWRHATDTEPRPALPRALHLVNLASALLALFNVTLAREHLDESIQRFREAEPWAPEMMSDGQVVYLRGVASALLTRFRVTGQLADVRDAVSTLHASLRLPHLLASDRSLVLGVLGYGLLQCARAEDAPNEARRAVDVLQDAVGLSPENPLLLVSALSGLGRAHRVLYDLGGNRAELDRAVHHLGRAASLSPDGSAWEVRAFSDLGEALVARYRAAVEDVPPDGGPPVSPPADGDLSLAAEVLQAAYGRTRTPELAGRLGMALSARVGPEGTSWTHGKARAMFAYACRKGMPEVSMPAGAAWGQWALQRGRWAEAEQAFGYALRAGDTHFATQAARAHKEGALRSVRGLAAGAAYAAARAGAPGRAVEILEQGRTRLVSEALQLGERAIVRLERDVPVLAERLRAAADTLAVLSALEEEAAVPRGLAPAMPGMVAERVVRARAELDAVLAEIRRHPGLDVFGAPMSIEQISAVARPAPLVYLAATSAGGMALLVEGEGRVSPIWLPELHTGAMRTHLESAYGYAAAYRAWRLKQIPGYEWARVLKATLRWAWDAAMEPVLEALAERGHPSAVLVPPGLLQLLPLHAAWTEDPGGRHGRRFAQDVAMLTYAPGARVLAAVSRPRPSPGAALLLVDNPDGSLGGADRDHILRLGGFDRSASRVLGGPMATLPAVLDASTSADVIQFTTHGRADVRNPMRSGVKLAEKRWLQVREILDTRLERDPLVFLSACETTLPGTSLPEEVVSLPTAFMQAGAGGVIASLWPVMDEETGALEVELYRRLGTGAPAARALHQVRGDLRADNPEPYHWAAFAYTGLPD